MRRGFLPLVPRPPRFVLGYHNVLPTAAFDGDHPELTTFRAQLRTVARRCEVVSLAGDATPRSRRRPTVALTFDDGYLDNATLLADLLLDLRLPATFFLVTSFLDGTDYPWWEEVAAICAHPGVTRVELVGRAFELGSEDDRVEAHRHAVTLCVGADLTQRHRVLAELRASAGPAGAEAGAEARARTPMMTWADARALVDAGFTVGSHTSGHAILAREDTTVVAEELVESKQRLEAELGRAVTTLAYPNGSAADFDHTAVRLAREAGYGHAVTTVPGLNTARTDPLRLHRMVLEPHMGGTALARSAATQLGGSAARKLLSRAPGARRESRSPRPSS